MEKLQLLRLELCNPLIFFNIILNNENLSINPGENNEFLLCFRLNPRESSSIEPNKDNFINSLIFSGQKAEVQGAAKVTLPSGKYLFVQQRGLTDKLLKTKWLDMAIEQQKDGLWERNKLGDLLYVRFLNEDEAFVTQVFRAITV